MHPPTIHAQKSPEPKRRRWRLWLAASLLLLGLGGLVWAVRPDPHLSRAKQLQKEFFSPEAKNLSPDERKAKFTELRQQVKHLNYDQKWELAAPMRQKQKAEMDRYFALSPREKVKYLDERIDRGEKMRKAFEKKGGGNGKAGGGPGDDRPGGGFGGKAGGGFGGPGGPNAGRPGGPPRSADQIEQRRKQFLDSTTPDERAKMDVFRKEMNDRRKQRGLAARG